ncbi:hypothetical protein SAMN02799630_05009 [Paenibacillus sp. UNCCL117]|uniref:Wadjet anti-phage system protein JetD domain-containing protein n=1 Tax=unclassified Paenibacillus TaxID=185978 RepID=UPI0008811801|nr:MULTISPECIES: Wadjet anti-phage system protein JetD domain-containing protein [unclassified Paenibacillus]SDE25691.1 hypothetical protein SAMN04488602_12322 [Paenibacillus sp. cl123]SFW62469.1 hypothetical protein SAMN02799630_05009 [Paenibacillus sp. UNCCL117]
MTVKAALIQYIRASRKVTVELEQLERVFAGQAVDYEAFADGVLQLERDGVLEPVKAHGRNGKLPALGYQYRIRRQSIREEYVRRLHRYGITLHPLIRVDRYYGMSEEDWERDWPYIGQIDSFLKRSDLPEREAPAPERSFELTGDEKWITEKGGQSLLERLGLWAKLRILPVSDPLMLAVNPAAFRMHAEAGAGRMQKPGEHSPDSEWLDGPEALLPSGRTGHGGEQPGGFPRQPAGNGGQLRLHRHLIVENKTTFQGLIGVLPETAFTTLIYGCGRKIVGNLGMLTLQVPMADGESVLYYFGDIDTEGIRIWHELRQRHRVRLAVPFYTACLEKEPVAGKENQRRKDEATAAFCSELPEGLGRLAAERLSEGYYWPQEILSSAELVTIWRTEPWSVR